MSDHDALQGFLDKWRGQWPEWAMAEAFVPEAHRERAQAWFALRDELSVSLGVLHLEDVQLDLLSGELLEVGTNALGLGATATDHDARTGGVDVDADAVTRALDLDAGHTGTVELRLQELADLDVLGHVVGVTLARLGRVGEPTRHVVRGDAEAEAVRIDLLAHVGQPFCSALSSDTTTVM